MPISVQCCPEFSRFFFSGRFVNYHTVSRNSSVEVKPVEADAKLFNRMF